MTAYVEFGADVAEVWRYPGGEIGVRARVDVAAPQRLCAHVRSSDEWMALVMYLAAVPGAVEEVRLPYLPYARQDRVAAPGDPDAVAAFARLAAATGVRRFRTLDVHSPAAIAAFRAAGLELTSESAVPWMRRFVAGAAPGPLWFVSPDAGARRRTAEAAAAISTDDRPVGVVPCRKVRDPVTGRLRAFAVEEDAPRELGPAPVVVVVDDICDGGGTFLGVAAALAERYGAAFTPDLWTTHGIYSRGLDDLLRVYGRLGCTDSFRHGLAHPRLTTLSAHHAEVAP
jgi:ribose-phosphate pyrophosphokinase